MDDRTGRTAERLAGEAAAGGGMRDARPGARRPHGWGRVALAFGLLLGWLAITALTAAPLQGTGELVELVSTGIARQLVFASGFLLLACWLLRWPDIGFRRPRGGTLRILWFPSLWILFLGAVALAIGPPAPGLAAILALNCLLVGLSEELMFRGVLLSGLHGRLRLWPAILVVTLCFGAVHVLNAFVTGDLMLAAIQAGAATMSGLLLMALRLRTGSLWPPILFHAAWDFASFCIAAGADLQLDEGAAAGGAERAVSLLFVAPLALYALFLLRRSALPPELVAPEPAARG